MIYFRRTNPGTITPYGRNGGAPSGGLTTDGILPRESAGGVAYELNLEAGAYSLTGADATFTRSIVLNLESSSYSITGQDVTFAYVPASRELNAEVGSYSLTGQDVSFFIDRVLNAGVGSYSISGQDASLTKQPYLSLESGSYSLSGQDVTIARTYVSNLESGSYTITGQDANLSVTVAYALNAEADTYVLTGQDVSFYRNYVFILEAAGESDTYAEPGYVETGYDSIRSYNLPGDYVEDGYVQSDYTGGTGASLVVSRILSADSGYYLLPRAAGAGKSRGKIPTIVVDVDGKPYRVPLTELPEFLDRVKIDARTPKPVKIKKKKGRNTLKITNKPPIVHLRYAPPSLILQIKAQIDRTNEIVEHIWKGVMQQYLNDLEDEETLLLLI